MGRKINGALSIFREPPEGVVLVDIEIGNECAGPPNIVR